MNDQTAFPFPLMSEAAAVGAPACATKDIRDTIHQTLQKDNTLCKAVLRYYIPNGITGNRLMDQGFAARLVLDASDLTKKYPDLNESLCAKHMNVVFKRFGYLFNQGRITGHSSLENMDEKAGNNQETDV